MPGLDTAALTVGPVTVSLAVERGSCTLGHVGRCSSSDDSTLPAKSHSVPERVYAQRFVVLGASFVVPCAHWRPCARFVHTDPEGGLLVVDGAVVGLPVTELAMHGCGRSWEVSTVADAARS